MLVKKILGYLLSLVIMVISVLILIMVSTISMLYNFILFVLMIVGLSAPMLIHKIGSNRSKQ